MKWGELQSVIQLAVAINTIYFSLKDIRATAEQREQNAIDSISAKIRGLSKPSEHSALVVYSDIRKSLTDLVVDFQEKLATLEKYDGYTRIFCLIVIAVYTLLLVLSCFYYTSDIGNAFSLALSIVGFLPICAGLVLNISFVRYLRANTIRKRQNIERQIIKL